MVAIPVLVHCLNVFFYRLDQYVKQASKLVGEEGKILFDEEELKMILGFNRGEDYIEVLCGTTNKVYGDYVGRLKINNKVAAL